MKLIGAVDIGGTKIAVGATDEDGFSAAIGRIGAALNEVADRAGCRLSGIGIACPGPLDPATGVIGDVGTLPGWQGGNLRQELEDRFQVQVAVENDADAATLAEARCGAGRGSSHLIYVTVSTGIGAGVLVDGRLYRGHLGAHPEIGHQIVDASSGSTCYCKASGCWESLASGGAIAAWMQQRRPAAPPERCAYLRPRRSGRSTCPRSRSIERGTILAWALRISSRSLLHDL